MSDLTASQSLLKDKKFPKLSQYDLDRGSGAFLNGVGLDEIITNTNKRYHAEKLTTVNVEASKEILVYFPEYNQRAEVTSTINQETIDYLTGFKDKSLDELINEAADRPLERLITLNVINNLSEFQGELSPERLAEIDTELKQKKFSDFQKFIEGFKEKPMTLYTVLGEILTPEEQTRLVNIIIDSIIDPKKIQFAKDMKDKQFFSIIDEDNNLNYVVEIYEPTGSDSDKQSITVRFLDPTSEKGKIYQVKYSLSQNDNGRVYSTAANREFDVKLDLSQGSLESGEIKFEALKPGDITNDEIAGLLSATVEDLENNTKAA